MIRIQSINAATGETTVREATPEEIREIEAVQRSSPTPLAVSRRQLILALHGAGLITDEEALAAAQTGEVPSVIDAAFAKLPPKEALHARVTWASMTEVRRDHPLVEAVIDAGLATAEQVDELFREAASL
jgi:predicted esterase